MDALTFLERMSQLEAEMDYHLCEKIFGNGPVTVHIWREFQRNNFQFPLWRMDIKNRKLLANHLESPIDNSPVTIRELNDAIKNSMIT